MQTESREYKTPNLVPLFASTCREEDLRADHGVGHIHKTKVDMQYSSSKPTHDKQGHTIWVSTKGILQFVACKDSNLRNSPADNTPARLIERKPIVTTKENMGASGKNFRDKTYYNVEHSLVSAQILPVKRL